jgi:hypothetical protein
MLSSYLQTATHDWLIVGSNGSIGSELTHGLRCFGGPGQDGPMDSHPHASEDYVSACLLLAHRHASDRPLRVVFSGGKGGFSLSEESCYQQERAFSEFCQRIEQVARLDKLILISSLGAHCSKLASAYLRLVLFKEKCQLQHLGPKSLILRLPSMYGWNRHERRHHGLIGVLYRHLRLRRTTDIYARMETRRNYLCMNQLSPLLLRAGIEGSVLERSGVINIQAAINLSIVDVCGSFLRATRQRPSLRLMTPSQVDAEHHYPTLLDGDKLIVNDHLDAWIKSQWLQPVRSFQS